MMKKQQIILKRLTQLLHQFYQIKKRQQRFIPGKTKVRYCGGWFDDKEVMAMLKVALTEWLALGTVAEKLEQKLTEYLGAKKSLLTNSGSSATLLCMATLTSRLLPKPLQPGDEVITPACTFATTVAAITHQRLTPRFIDVELETLNPNLKMIEKAIRKKTRAILIPHTLGNPNDMVAIMKLARQHNLYVIEDNCDGLGSLYANRKTGSFGHLAAESFYPAHHITTGGEGGAVIINQLELYRTALTLRNWGRSCWCLASEKHHLGACRNRFNYTLEGNIPIDHRYLFSELGYNLKMTEIQAAMGLVQLKRFPQMARARRRNFKALYKFFQNYDRFFYLPQSLPKADPCWFAFPLTIRDKVPFSRNEILTFLGKRMIEGRSLFAGNIVRHPALKGVDYKISGNLKNSDKILQDTFFIGVWPGIGQPELAYMQEVLTNYLKQF